MPVQPTRQREAPVRALSMCLLFEALWRGAFAIVLNLPIVIECHVKKSAFRGR